MRIVSVGIHPLKIPFRESFSHRLHERDHSDSIIVRVTSACGATGFGEGVPRPYVTGETRDASIEHIRNLLIPGIIGAELDETADGGLLERVNELIPRSDASRSDSAGVTWNASRCAVELAVIDCALHVANAPLAQVLPAKTREVVYSGVIGAGLLQRVEVTARRCQEAGLRFVKLKVGDIRDVEKVALVREILGPSVSLRLDANAAFDRDSALRFLDAVARYDIACVEQPLPRGDLDELAALRVVSPIPIMVDESLVTMADAEELAKRRAVDHFNLRVSKCGGLRDTLAIAAMARKAGIGIQVGCQVGETAILSAAGRHLAAHLGDPLFVEGSYGALLLEADIAEEKIDFGPGGVAPVLTGAGLGVTVRQDLLDRYSETTIEVTR